MSLFGCSNNTNTEMKNYDDYIKNHVKADDFCNIDKEIYYIYAYQIGCPPCSELRELIFNTLDSDIENLYLYDAENYRIHDKHKFKKRNDQLTNEEMVLGMIEAKATCDIYMLSTPSLYIFKNNTLVKYEYEFYSIESTIKLLSKGDK